MAQQCARVGDLFPPDAVKRVAPELMHLTLAFIGWTTDSTVAVAGRAVRESVAGRTAIVCRLGEVGAFPTLDRPRVVWVGLAEGADAVRAAAEAIRVALRAAGVAFDEKPPVAHLTVARVRDDVTRDQRDSIAAAARTARVEPLRFEVTEAVLFESRLARTGPTYLPLERVPLEHGLPSARRER